MRYYKRVIWTFVSLFVVVMTTYAQGQCDIDVDAIVQRVTEDCADIAENEVCYGNRDVSVTPRLNTVDFVFANPGDRADLYNITSLVVDSVDPSENTWGVAQMRLQVGSETGLQDVTMLLFGSFDVENAVERTATVEMQVLSFQKSVHRDPNPQSDILENVESRTLFTAVGRLEDSTWLRVENMETGVVGWVENLGLQLVDESRSVGLLPVQMPDEPYYGAMQAFYFENGSSNIGCDSVASDGLIIQTPEGQARISLLINEVSIELIGAQSDDGGGNTTFVDANIGNGSGMAVNVINGEANLETVDGTQTVTSGQQSSIPLSIERVPVGAPSEPTDVDLTTVDIRPLLPAVTSSSNTSDDSSTSINVQDNASNGDDSSASTVNITGNGSGTSADNSTTTNGGGITVDTENPFDNPDPDLPGSVDEINAANQPPPEPEEPFLFSQGNRLAFGIAVIAACLVLIGIIWNNRRTGE